jgi:ABC-type sugar transport system substrate-binding protein
MRRLNTRAFLFFLLLGVMIGGCARDGSRAPSKRIAGMVFQEDQFFRLVLFGMRDAAAKAHVELLEANSNSRPDREIQLVNTYIAQGVDAIVISPLSARASVSALRRARDAGITVITYNTTIEGDVPSVFVESDQYHLGASTGRAARAYIQERLGGRADIAIVTFISQAPEQGHQRTDGFKDQVTELPGVRIVAEQDAWMAEQAVKKVGDMLTANPGIEIIWAANEGGTVGAVMAVKNTGKAGRVVVFGTDMSEQMANFLLAEDGVLQAATGQRPFEIGSMAVDAAVRVLRGDTVASKISLEGVLLTRDDPSGILAYKNHLASLTE